MYLAIRIHFLHFSLIYSIKYVCKQKKLYIMQTKKNHRNTLDLSDFAACFNSFVNTVTYTLCTKAINSRF